MVPTQCGGFPDQGLVAQGHPQGQLSLLATHQRQKCRNILPGIQGDSKGTYAWPTARSPLHKSCQTHQRLAHYFAPPEEEHHTHHQPRGEIPHTRRPNRLVPGCLKPGQQVCHDPTPCWQQLFVFVVQSNARPVWRQTHPCPRACFGMNAPARCYPQKSNTRNQASAEYKAAIEASGKTYKLVPPNDHRRNMAKRAIQTFKDHLVGILSGCASSMPIHLWCQLLLQVKHQLLLL